MRNAGKTIFSTYIHPVSSAHALLYYTVLCEYSQMERERQRSRLLGVALAGKKSKTLEFCSVDQLVNPEFETWSMTR